MAGINQLFRQLIFVVVLIAPGLQAHHAMEVHYFTEEASIVEHSGTLKKFTPLNPHSYLVVTVETEEGPKDWVLEALGRDYLSRSGWPFDMLTPGARLSFRAFPARSGEPAGRLQLLQLADRVMCSEFCEGTGNLLTRR